MVLLEGNTTLGVNVGLAYEETALEVNPRRSVGDGETIVGLHDELVVGRLTDDVLVAHHNLVDRVAILVAHFELVTISRTDDLGNSHLLATHVEEELSHSLVLAGVVVSKLHLDGLLAGCAIQHKGFLAVFALNHLAPDGRRGETPVLVGLEGEVELVAGITCDGLYLWEHRVGVGVVVARTSA